MGPALVKMLPKFWQKQPKIVGIFLVKRGDKGVLKFISLVRFSLDKTGEGGGIRKGWKRIKRRE